MVLLVFTPVTVSHGRLSIPVLQACCLTFYLDPQYNIDKPANEEDYEDEDEDEDGFTGAARRPDVVEDDPIEG